MGHCTMLRHLALVFTGAHWHFYQFKYCGFGEINLNTKFNYAPGYPGAGFTK